MHASHTRRQILKRLAATTPLAALAGTQQLDAAPSPAPIIPELDTDVLVIGGGAAGTIAAIQAARLGARTTLVEAGSQLGGTTTTGGVNYPGLFHAWGKQVIAGIGWELVRKSVELLDDPFPDFATPPPTHSKHQVRVSIPTYTALAEELCREAKVSLRLYESPLTAERSARGWTLLLAGKGCQRRVHAQQLIDCTGNAAVIGMLGLARERGTETQPGTLMFRLAGYDLKSIDLDSLELDRKQALLDGRLEPTDCLGSFRSFLAGGGNNAMHLPGADSSDSERHTETNMRGRRALLRILRFLKAHPGFERLRPEWVATEVGVRETFRIVGETTITLADYTSGRVYPDAVAHSFYPIDLHVEGGVTPEPLRQGIVPTIPLGALIPRGSTNLLAAGRCVSSDRLANSALRVQASCMAMGQAAGAAAALAARSATSPGSVPIEEVRRALGEHGAIVPRPS